MKATKQLETFRDSTGRRWINQSVVALMKQKSLVGETPQAVIRRLARDLVIEARKDGWEGIPFDPEILAELKGIKVKPACGDIRADARLMPQPDRRLEIEYSSDAPETRRRFSICHEIAHTFFPDCFEQVQHRRIAEYFDPVHAELEQLCHLGASELLMPLAEFEAAWSRRSPSMAVAEELGLCFNASPEASMRRMVDLTSDTCCLLWLSLRLKPKEEKDNGPEFDFGFDAPKPKLRVDYRFASPSWQTFVPEHKSVPDASMLYAILKSSEIRQGIEDWSDLKLGSVGIEAVLSQHSEPSTRGLMVLLKQT